MQRDREALDTYLNDHLAASVAALQLIDRLCSTQEGTPLGALMARLQEEITDEQEVVRSLLASEDGSEKRAKQAIAWVGEKLSRFKIGSDSEAGSGLMLFEALEALSVGFWGRHQLWCGLAEVSTTTPFDSSIDFAALASRARQHIVELEPFRLEAALRALTVPSTTAP